MTFNFLNVWNMLSVDQFTTPTEQYHALPTIFNVQWRQTIAGRVPTFKEIIFLCFMQELRYHPSREATLKS